MSKYKLFLIISIAFLTFGESNAQQPKKQGKLKELFAGPANPSVRDAWLSEMENWRTVKRDKLRYNNSEYLRPELSWLKKSFIYVQMMAHERYFYDPLSQRYTVDRYLDDLEKRYGGVDAVLIWPTYPNIGVDDRNQYDLLHDMPGGIKAIKQMIKDFHKRGVKVFFPIMSWDHGTRAINETMAVALVKEMKEVGADGLNGDTMNGIPIDYKKAYDSLDYPIGLHPEWRIKNLKMVEWNTASWGYWWNFPFVPGVSIVKWLEPRHQVYLTNRWAVNKTNDLQYAFFNGVGFNTWENIWGTWNQIPKRYEEEIRRISSIYRQFPGIWNSTDWEPFIPTLQKGVFTSKFPETSKTIFTFVNRGSFDLKGKQIQLPYQKNVVYYDLWNGAKLIPKKEQDHILLSFPIEARGFGAVLAIRNSRKKRSLNPFLNKMKLLAEKPLKSYPARWKPLKQSIVEIERTNPSPTIPKDMVFIPAGKNYTFESHGVMIEGDPLPNAVGIQYPWEKHPERSTRHVLDIPAFYIDKYPVTNKQYKQFLDATHYYPKDDHNFLKDWENRKYPDGWANKPVTWVSLGDARAYARWAGKRLPHEWEWQYAAQGTDGRLYPWGDSLDMSKIPPMDSSRSMRSPTDVDKYSQGASPFGVVDMVGNVWQWTDEYVDEHTRAAIVKGSGYYRPTTSKWYFPRTYELNKYGKYLLMASSLDRSASIGFRCVKDK